MSKNYKVTHRLPGRVRLVVPGLKRNRSMAAVIMEKISHVEGVYQVEANPMTGRALVLFNENQLTLANLIVDLKNISNSPEVYRSPQVTGGNPYEPTEHPEPEDQNIRKQMIHVALCGGALAYLSLKHILYRRTHLANHPHIFNLAALTAIVSGYPLLRSGFEKLAKGKVNYELVMGGLALGTILARESIPGLLVVWLTNTTALGQSLVFRGYRNALPSPPEFENQTIKKPRVQTTPEWNKAAQKYEEQSVIPALGMAAFTGITRGKTGFSRALAMLLAANPAPAALAAPTAATAAMGRASKEGIYFRDAKSLETVARVDTVIFDGSSMPATNSYRLGNILPMPGLTRRKVQQLAIEGSAGDSVYAMALRKALLVQDHYISPGKTGAIVVGSEETLEAAGINTEPGAYNARRLQHLGQVPIFVGFNERLAGVIGLRRHKTGGIKTVLEGLRIHGINNIGVSGNNSPLGESANKLGFNHIWVDLPQREMLEQLQKLKKQGQRVAVLLGRDSDTGLLEHADVTIGIAGLNNHPVDVIINDLDLLPDVFAMAIWGEQRARQNLAVVQAANALGLALGASGRLPPMVATVYSNLISVVLGINSFRLLNKRITRIGKDSSLLKDARQEIAAALVFAENYCESPPNQRGQQTTRCTNWHSLSGGEAIKELSSDLDLGLVKVEAQQRLNIYGNNEMIKPQPPSFLARLMEQLKDFLVKALIASAAVCGLMGQFRDALAIATILILNAILGAVQEQKAEGSLEALREMTAPTAKVKRDGEVQRIPAHQLVPGDIVLLEQGDGVPADLRLLEVHDLEIEESALTGESYPVRKSSSRLAGCIPLLDCENLAFMGTNVTKGRAVGLVINTGMATEIGRIAGMLNQQDSQKEMTPLQSRMADVGSIILKYCLGVSAVIVLAGILRGTSVFQMFLTGVSLAVAAIPEGLPAVVTIAMASGVRRMAKENAVVRKLPAVETLGSATLICTDKTGTLTQNRQHVQSVFTGNGWWHMEDKGKLLPEKQGLKTIDLDDLLAAGVVCNDANLLWSKNKSSKGKKLQWQVEGDPTEGALLMAALDQQLNYKELRENNHRVKEIPFNAERLRMTVICKDNKDKYHVYVKGAPEVVVGLCSHIQRNGPRVPLENADQKAIAEANKHMAGNAMRVLAIARRTVQDAELPDPEKSLTLLGLVGMADPPRPEVRDALATCHRAGIKVAMITGDHPHTALAIAQRVGITSGRLVLTGKDIDNMNDFELAAALGEVRVFARVLPAHKLRLIKTFQRRGEILAMVGDGINDAPAVKEADIGVAMGQTGTDVTKQAADIVLLDDNFATLVSAAEQGRGIYCNIRRSVRYLLSTNVGLVSMVGLSVLLGLPMTLLPIQLLFLNVLGDGLPALALGVEKPSKNLMEQPPRPAKQSFFADGLNTQIISRGLSSGIVGLTTYSLALRQGNIAQARTVALAGFIASKLLYALECSEQKEGGYNKYLIGSVALSSALLAAAIYLPVGRSIFKTTPLNLSNVSLVLSASVLTYIADRVIGGILLNRQKESCPC